MWKESFEKILDRIPIDEFLRIYHLAHEMGEDRVVAVLDSYHIKNF